MNGLGGGQPRHAPPWPAALAESLRGVGYALPDAIADIIDNSVSAGARSVWLYFQWNGKHSYIAICDDGKGLASEEIVQAMRPGVHGPRAQRALTDLGRFGLGLKTASLSQCRRLTLGSRVDAGPPSSWRWDLDYIQAEQDWYLLPGTHEGSEAALLKSMPPERGTVVLWEVMDRVPGCIGAASDRSAQESFLAAVDEVEAHLAMVFHRFLEGSTPQLRIFINGHDESSRVKPWDPFMLAHPATVKTPEERVPTKSGPVSVQGFILPHRDRLDEAAYKGAGGIRGWGAQQGFYVYRNGRMLVAGSWLGLGDGVRTWTKEEAYRLARLRLDIPNSADEEWKIDIKKSRATPPIEARQRLSGLAGVVRDQARRVLAYRGSPSVQAAAQTVVRAWAAHEGRGGAVRYTVNRQHPAVRHALETAGARREAVEALLRVIEQTVPVQRIWLDVSERSEAAMAPEGSVDLEEMRVVMQAIFDDMLKSTQLSEHGAKQLLMSMEPFARHPELITQLVMRGT